MKTVFQKIKKKELIILMCCVAVHLFFILFGSLKWETNDDEMFSLIAAGSWGISGAQYLIYQNVILGWVVKILSILLPNINMYVFLFLLINCLSTYLLCLKCSEKKSLCVGVSVVLLLNLLLFKDFFSVLQYTKSAFLWSATGWIYIYDGIKEDRKSDRVIGYIFALLGFMLRKESCLFSVPYFIVFVLIGVFKTSKAKTCKSIGILAAVIVSAFLVNKFAYSSDEWKYYLEFNKYRTQLLDYGIPDYYENEDACIEIGVSANDLEMLRHWNYADLKVFSPQVLKSINSIKPKAAILSVSNISETFKALYTATHNENLYPCIYCCLVFLTVFLGNNKTKVIGLLFSILIFAEYYFLVVILKSRIVYRAEMGVWLVPILILLYCAFNENKSLEEKNVSVVGIILSISLCAINGAQLCYNFAINKKMSFIADENSSISTIRKISEKYLDSYVLGDTISFQSMTYMIAPNIFDVTNEKYDDLFSRFNLLGTWVFPSPLVLSSEAKCGITNPIENLLDDNVYYAEVEERSDGERDVILRFLQEHYDDQTTVEYVEQIDDAKIFKFKKGS